jgi:hypothetical protein
LSWHATPGISWHATPGISWHATPGIFLGRHARNFSGIVVGGDQVRAVRFAGRRMVLAPPLTAVNGVTRRAELYWERISSTPA